MRLLAGIILITASLAVPLQASAQNEVSGVAHVVDGDTVHLATPGSDKIVKVRLQGVAAPERGEAGGAAATRFVEQMAEGREVRCELDGSRSKDRVVGICFVGSQDIGAALIAAGLPYPSYCLPRQKSSAGTGAQSATTESRDSLTVALYGGTPQVAPQVTPQVTPQVEDILEHGGGLNGCGCHFNRKTGECHCHRGGGCGCACEPPSCVEK